MSDEELAGFEYNTYRNFEDMVREFGAAHVFNSLEPDVQEFLIAHIKENY